MIATRRPPSASRAKADEDVPKGGAPDLAIDMRGNGEGRVHQHDARPDGAIEAIVDLRRVVARNGEIREQQAEEISANVGEFVERKRHAVPFTKNRQQPGAGRQVEDNLVALNDCSRDRRDEAKTERRRELLIRWLSSERRVCVGGQARLRAKASRGGARASEPGVASAAPYRREKEDLRDEKGLIGVLP